MNQLQTELLRERQHQFELRRQQALASAAAHQAAAQQAAYNRSLVQAQKYHTWIQQQRELAEKQKEEALIARIHERANAKSESADYVKEHVSRGAASAIDQVFNQIDTDRNNMISYAEFNHFCKLHGVTDEVVQKM